MTRRVLITRLSWFLSQRLAGALERELDIDYVLGVDRREPAGEFTRTEFLRLDARSSAIQRVMEAAQIDTVVSLGLFSTPREAGGAAAMHDLNVIGAMQLLAACQKAESVKRVVVRSSTAVYGSSPTSAAIDSEDSPLEPTRDPFARDVVEVESYARELVRRRPDIELVLLRFANILGPTADTPLAHYLRMPIVPTHLGFDPRLQFVHEDDAVGVLVQAVLQGGAGTYNVSGDGVVYLSQVIRMGARLPLPLPGPLLEASAPAVQLLARGLQVPPHVLRLVRWGRVADAARLKERFGYTPRRSTRETVAEFYAERRTSRLAAPHEQGEWERDVNEFLVRQGQERFLERSRVDRPAPVD